MLTRACLLTIAAAALAFCFTGHAQEKVAPVDEAEAAVRLRLNAMESALRIERYQTLLRQLLDVEERVKAEQRAGGKRAADLMQRMQETQSDLQATKKRLIELEAEKLKLTRALGMVPKAAAASAPDRTLDKILDRLNSIDKRLGAVEKALTEKK